MKWRDPLQFGGVSWRRTYTATVFLCRHQAAASTGATADIMLHLVLAASALALSASASAAGVATRSTPVAPFVNLGTTTAVEELLDRVLPGSRAHFTLELAETCPGAEPPCFVLTDDGDKVKVTATGAAELASGIGVYFRERCNMVIGWPRGGGSNVFIPSAWPKIGSTPLVGKRNTPWSYMMNVCTHSYSLVWYSWQDWEVCPQPPHCRRPPHGRDQLRHQRRAALRAVGPNGHRPSRLQPTARH
jgi:hypothetical protein